MYWLNVLTECTDRRTQKFCILQPIQKYTYIEPSCQLIKTPKRILTISKFSECDTHGPPRRVWTQISLNPKLAANAVYILQFRPWEGVSSALDHVTLASLAVKKGVIVLTAPENITGRYCVNRSGEYHRALLC